jgi:hypothetical protein
MADNNFDFSGLTDNQLKFIYRHKLNDNQIANALLVDKESRLQGVNPEFVWPMVMRESEFRSDALSSAGALGVMQLIPSTAKGLNVDSSDNAQNIRGGVTLLKNLIDNPKIGDDPYKVLAGYNASTNTRNKFYESGNLDVLPDETLKHMNSVAKFYGGELPSVLFGGDQSQATNENGYNKQPVESQDSQPSQQVIQNKKEASISPVTEELLASGLGYKAGLATGATKMGAVKLGQKAYDYINNDQSPKKVVTPSVKGQGHGGENWVKGLTDVDLPGGQMTKNDLHVAQGMQNAVGRNGEPGFTGGKITEGGILISPQTASKIESSKTIQTQSFLKNIMGLLEYGSPQQKDFAAKVWSSLGPKGQQAAEGLMFRAKQIPSIGGFGSIGYGAGMAVPNAVANYANGDLDAALGNVATGAGIGAGLAMVPKAAPFIGGALSALDIGSRLANDDKTGAAISSAGVLGPIAAGALLAPPIGIPVAIGSTMIPAAINAYRDYVAQPKALAGRGFVNPPRPDQ